jgi:hypothetical protein
VLHQDDDCRGFSTTAFTALTMAVFALIEIANALQLTSAWPTKSIPADLTGNNQLHNISGRIREQGSPDASTVSGNGSPSVCSTSYLGIPQSGEATAFLYRADPVLSGHRMVA